MKDDWHALFALDLKSLQVIICSTVLYIERYPPKDPESDDGPMAPNSADFLHTPWRRQGAPTAEARPTTPIASSTSGSGRSHIAAN